MAAMKFFDFHVHIFPEKIVAKAVGFLENHYQFQWECSGTENDFQLRFREAKINKCVIFSSATKPEQMQNINDFISRRAASRPDFFVGFGTLHPDNSAWKTELDRFPVLNLHGVKLHPDFQQFDINAPKAMKMYEELEMRNLPILVHLGDRKLDFSKPSRLAEVAKKFPRLRIVAAHMGGYSAWDEARDKLAGFPNVWFDTSSTFPFLGKDEFIELIYTYGIEKIMMGSDYPSKTPQHATQEIMNLDIPEADKESISFRNACRFLNLPE
ncbi:MAG: amidohydrolase family protein [Victivallaceae bacterium]|nr:amidohydrolase family protein [Victivallaceae bacterium]